MKPHLIIFKSKNVYAFIDYYFYNFFLQIVITKTMINAVSIVFINLYVNFSQLKIVQMYINSYCDICQYCFQVFGYFLIFH